jgi:hypothetical protein
LEGIVQDVPTQAVEHDLLADELLRRRVQGIEAVVKGERLRLLPETNADRDSRQWAPLGKSLNAGANSDQYSLQAKDVGRSFINCSTALCWDISSAP